MKHVTSKLPIPKKHTLTIASLNLLSKSENLNVRVDNLIKEVETLNIDVLCLQEILLTDTEMVKEKFKQFGFAHVAVGDPSLPAEVDDIKLLQQNIILSKHEIVETTLIDLNVEDLIKTRSPSAVCIKLNINGYNVHITTAHLAWSAVVEWKRIRQAEIISRHALHVRTNDPDSILILAGDLNAQENSSTLRYLKGLQESPSGTGTLWLDAWEMFGTEDNWVTSNPETFWGKAIAQRHSPTFTQLIPKRRIDYIMAYEWCYGQKGSPLSFDTFSKTETGTSDEVSDHYGVISKIYVPLNPN